MTSKTRVLFLCVANSARSQMAEALLRHTDPDGYEAFSAGTLPDEVDRRARMALDQLGEQVQLHTFQALQLQNQVVEMEQEVQLPLRMELIIVVMGDVELIQELFQMADQV